MSALPTSNVLMLLRVYEQCTMRLMHSGSSRSRPIIKGIDLHRQGSRLLRVYHIDLLFNCVAARKPRLGTYYSQQRNDVVTNLGGSGRFGGHMKQTLVVEGEV